jgi:protein O-GlcNAc transferase
MYSDIPPQLTTELQQAIAFHKAGQLQEAQALYRAILQTRPNHPEANHNMGVLAVQLNQAAAGLSYFLAALEAEPAQRQYWLSYIDALLQAGQPEAAKEVLALARQQGLQGAEVEALAVRLAGGTHQPASSGTLPVSPAPAPAPAPAAAPAPAQNGQAKHARSGTRKNPTPEEMNALVSLFAEGQYTDAEKIARKMTELYPRHEFGWKVLGMVLKQIGRNADALLPMQKAAALSPYDAQAHGNLGVTLKDAGRLNDAENSLRRALRINPDYVQAHGNLGAILKDMGRLSDAEVSLRRALQIKPDYADAHSNLGATLMALGRPAEAEASYRQVLQINPDFAHAYNALGISLQGQGRLFDAEDSYRRALQIQPDFADAHNNLGLVLHDLCRLDEACASYRRALQIKPDLAEVHSNLGLALQELGYMDDAEASLRLALQFNPDFASAHCNLGNTLMGAGRLFDAEASYRRALQIQPDLATAHSNLIFNLDLMVGIDTASLREERRRWNAAHAVHLHQQQRHTNIPNPERRLRVGYVSADFRIHSAAYAFGAMLVDFDPLLFDVIAYSNAAVEDTLTWHFQKSVTIWRKIFGLSDDAVADMIRADEIDILVDLSGHSAGNRLLVFARKPAPIQITAWGYAAGTGMSAMDVFFTDPVMVPPEEVEFYTEQVRYLPNALGFFFADAAPDVNALPALSTKEITFGSFNRLVKNSDEVYGAWAEILRATPESRMIMKTPALDDAGTREQVREHFTRAGINPERIILQGKTTREEHLAAFNQIDIALDPFPQGGGVSTLEGLMMGVPVITLRWPTLAGRVSASILTTLGLTDWIAETQEQYVNLAIQKAKDLQHLAELRQQLRSIFTSSILGDQVAYARGVEQEYRHLWRQWSDALKSS